MQVAARQATKLQSLQRSLLAHPIYQSVKSEKNMKIFMETHVYAVWDFMFLLKGLQRRLTCTQKIWRPNVSPNSARFINEIVVGEQSDTHPNRKDHISHFELYVEAMKEVGADTRPILNLVNGVIKTGNIFAELKKHNLPEGAASFVLNTVSSLDKPTPYVASQFFYGRQDPIPQMFRNFITQIGDNKKYNMVRYYLQRHIDIDGDSHGPMAKQLMDDLASRQDPNYEIITEAAINAVQHRIKLWDSIYKRLEV